MVLLGHEKQKADLEQLVVGDALGHAYIFFGQNGLGKKGVAVAFARFLEQGVWENASLNLPPLSDLLLIGPAENGSIGIDEARSMKLFLSQRPAIGTRRVIIVDSADTMTDEAQNAMLKIAEEPGNFGLLILVLDDPEKLRPTLRSRFRQIYFAPLKTVEVERVLVEFHNVPSGRANSVALISRGSPGLAVRIAKDESFQALLGTAKKFLQADKNERKELIKVTVKDDSFNLDKFLEAVAIVAAGAKNKPVKFWHTLLEMRRDASQMGLNGRIQLMALSETLG